MFSPDLLEKIILHSEHFLNEKDRNHLSQGFLNMVDGIEKTSLKHLFFSSVILADCNLALL